MSPRFRTFLFGFLACAVAVWAGIAIANEQYLGSTLFAGVAIWAALSWTTSPRTEVWPLAFLIFGYVVGNRGFAQATPIPSLPVFFGELGLLVSVTLLVVRGALERTLPVRRDALNSTLLFWAAIGAGLVLFDLRHYGLVAIRDFALVYYCLFFFVAQELVKHAPSRRVLEFTLRATFAIAPLTGLAWMIAPEFFVQNLLINRVPLIFYKDDLLATYLMAGFVWIVPKESLPWRSGAWRWLSAVACLALGGALLSRAALVGLAMALGWLVIGRRWLPIRAVLGAGAAALILVAIYSAVQQRDFTQTRIYALYEHVVSVADFSGTRQYRNQDSRDSGDNNRFRFTWWRNVARETLTTSPVLGLGFGHDIARGFLLEYYPVHDSEFTTRAPHNVLVTVLGRMGLLGLGAFVAWMAALAWFTSQAMRAARSDARFAEPAALYAACWVILVSATFGVVLEGPMGAIPFWIMLGWGHGLMKEARATENAPTSVDLKSAKPKCARLRTDAAGV